MVDKKELSVTDLVSKPDNSTIIQYHKPSNSRETWILRPT